MLRIHNDHFNFPATNTRIIDIIRYLLLIIFKLMATLEQKEKILCRQAAEIIALKVNLNSTKRVFAPKNEKIPTTEKSSGSKKRKRGAQPGRKPRSRNIPDKLKKEKIEQDFPEVPICISCNTPYIRLSALDVISNQVNIVWETVLQVISRHKYKKDCNCKISKTIITAPPRESVIKKSILTTSSWVHLIIMKYMLAVPIYRYRQAMISLGYKLSPGTVENGFKKIGKLLKPVYESMIDELRKNRNWNADETRWKVFEKIKGKTSYLWWLWVFASANVVVYVIDPTRSASVVDRIHDGTKRFLSADRYSAYEAMKSKGILIAYCWVHLRRDFFNLLSVKDINIKHPDVGEWIDDWLLTIKKIFKLNEQRLKTSSEKEFLRLTEELRSITEKLRQQDVDTLPFKFQKKILKSFKKRFDGYTLFIDYPEIPPHNNRAEQLLKTAINGRKNYLGNVSQHSVEHTQIFLSIIATAKNNKVDSQLWLKEYLHACAKNDSQPLQGDELKSYTNKLMGITS